MEKTKLIVALRNIAYLASSQVSRVLIPLIVLPVISSKMSASEISDYLFIQVVVAWLMIIIDYGVNLSATKEIAGTNERAYKLQIFVDYTIVRLVISVALIPGVFLFIADVYESILIILLAVVMGMLPNFYFQAEGKYRLYSLLDIITNLFFLGGCLILSQSELITSYHVLSLLLGLRFSYLLVLYSYIYIDLIKGQEYEFNRKRLFSTAYNGFPMAAFRWVASLYTSAVGMISNVSNMDGSNSLYLAADRVSRPALYFIGPISDYFYPRLCQSNTLILRSQAFVLLLFGGLSVSFLIYFLGADIVSFLFSGKIKNTDEILKILSAVPLLVALSNFFGIQVMLVNGMVSIFNGCILIGAMLGVICITLMTMEYGARGTALGVVFTEFLILFLTFYFGIKKVFI